MLLVRSPPSSAVGFDSGELPKNGGNKNNNGRSPDLKQQKPVANLCWWNQSKSAHDFRNHSNGHDIDLNGPAQQNNSSSNLQNQMQNQHGESVKTMVNCAMPQDVANGEQAAQLTNFPASLMQIFGNGQLPQLYAALNPQTSVDSVLSLPHSASLPPPITSMDAQLDPAAMWQKQYDPIADSVDINKPGNDLKQQKAVANLVLEENSKSIPEKWKQEQESICARIVDANTKIVDGTIGKDEKAMRLFKNALVDFVKELLKPKWKEGQMSREVHKAIVKKVVDKVTSTIQGANIPKTQEIIDQYLAYSKPMLNILVEGSPLPVLLLTTDYTFQLVNLFDKLLPPSFLPMVYVYSCTNMIGIRDYRTFMQEKIFELLKKQKQRAHDVPPKQFQDFVKRLDEDLFRNASAKEQYFLPGDSGESFACFDQTFSNE
ncbi:hypothetical protein Acr_11g0008270 [Actinidia rufa]|uniref:SFR19-like C-terminal domain-containing protein n=1 Tax=Actinidia rufa TaxID=165716 RepID=A0A7J0FCW9_9ERIC|nr:hypothetical protein Acr_11g0008270 [Actinidia rufa]